MIREISAMFKYEPYKRKIYSHFKDSILIIVNSPKNPIEIGESTAKPRKQLKGIILQSLIETGIDKIDKILIKLFVKAPLKNIRDPISRGYNAFFTWNMSHFNSLNLRFDHALPPIEKLEVYNIIINKKILDLSFKKMKEHIRHNLSRIPISSSWIQGRTEERQGKILNFYAKKLIQEGFNVKKNQRFKFDIKEAKIQDEIDIIAFKNSKMKKLIEIETINTQRVIILGSIVNLLAFSFSKDIERELIIGGELESSSKYEKFIKEFLDPLRNLNIEIKDLYVKCKRRIKRFGKTRVIYEPLLVG